MRPCLVFCLSLAAALGGCRWSDVPPGAVYACDQSAACPDGHACDGGYCFPVGGCAGGSCACQPAEAAAACTNAGLECGEATLPDGCGASRGYQCGTGCGDGGVCRTNHCCALPSAGEACADAGHACGALEFNACGRTLVFDCGGCSGTDRCDITEASAVCAPCVPESNSAFCSRLGATCGSASGSDNCGTPRTASCGVVCDDAGINNGR